MKILREPLLHFLILGAAIFGIYNLVSRHTEKPGEIVVTRGKIENLATAFARAWQRPPTEQELNGLVREYVREEVAYREAKAMGLDQDDTIIRRRLHQKLDFVSEDLAELSEPTDAELQAYLKLHAKDFETETTLTFRHVYFSPMKHGPQLEQDAQEALSKLKQMGGKAETLAFGDSFVLDYHFENVSTIDVKKLFGEEFGVKVSALKPGQWQGPIESAYGEHLVLVIEHKEGGLPALNDVRDHVRREWANTKRVETKDRFYQTLLARYTVKIEPAQEKKIAKMR